MMPLAPGRGSIIQRLAELALHGVGDGARRDVDQAAGRAGQDHADRLAGYVSARAANGAASGRDAEQQQTVREHVIRALGDGRP